MSSKGSGSIEPEEAKLARRRRHHRHLDCSSGGECTAHSPCNKEIGIVVERMEELSGIRRLQWRRLNGSLNG